MWNCSAVLTRNGSLCNSTVSLTTKDSYLQRYITSTLKKRLFKTHALAIEEHSCAEKIRVCSLNRISTAPCNQTFGYATAARISIKDSSIRRFHTCLTAKRTIDLKDVLESKSSDTSGTSPNLHFDKLITNDNSTEDKVPYSNVAEKTPLHDASPLSDHHVKSSKISIKDVEKMYPNAKSKLHDIYQLVKNDKKVECLNVDYTRSKGNTTWQCTLSVLWPEKMSFVAKSSNKNNACNAAAYKCLYWLEVNKRLNRGIPILYNSTEIEDIIKRPVKLSVKEDTLNVAKIILDKYQENIQSIIESHDHTLHIERPGFQEGAVIDPVGMANPTSRNPDRIAKRNQILRLRHEHRMNEGHIVDLPITDYRKKIIEAIENNNVVVIKGDTGCGKTTQVPQFIMDSFVERGQATDCNMIVAQPRRISAISLAERMADERHEQVGDVVGYQVRLSQELPNTPAGILFCTTGILLRKLQFNPSLEGCTHVIVDEAHERTINTDMLLVLLKRAIQKRPSLKVIVMSATINAELFQEYFQCGLVEVPGRLYPVQMHFLEDIEKLGLRSPSRWDLTFEESEKENTGPTVDIVKMGELISYISRSKPPGAILCFLPGWSEISKMKKYLEDYSFLPKSQTLIVPVHSKMSHYDQRKIFSKPPSHVRKIVLATDIAETGITIADVVYVVDSCTHRQIQWHEKRGFQSIDNHWASQANINQRKGRAGRVQPGVSYHFITRDKFAELPPYPAPEILRSSLEKTVLDAKTYSPELAINFLGSMPQPPSNSVIRRAIEHLYDLGALDQDENLTPLGKRIALFTLNPELSKAVVYSSIFQCLSPMITIASIMSGESEIFTGVLQQKAAIRDIKSIYHPSSDHVSLAWLFQQWYDLDKVNKSESREFAMKSRVVHEKMYTLSKVREINAQHLHFAQMLPDVETLDNFSAKENEYAELDELCRGVLLAGLDHVLHHRDFDIRKGQIKKGTDTFVMEDGSRATITPESVNFKRKYWPSPFMTYVRRTHSEERRTALIRETSMISPLTVFLFTQARIVGFVHKRPTENQTEDAETEILFTMKDRRNMKLICNKNTADVLLNFRDAMWGVVRYLVANYGVNSNNSSEFDQVEVFKMEMLQVLGKMLSEASESIDNPEPPKKNENVKQSIKHQ